MSKGVNSQNPGISLSASTSALKEFLQIIYPVGDAILEEYISQWEEYAELRKTLVTSTGKTEYYLYFVVEGIQKSYYLNEGKEHIIAFTYPPSFPGIPDSFLTRSPSNYYLETITDSRFLRLSYEHHHELMIKYRPIKTLLRKAAEQVLVGVLERHYELMKQRGNKKHQRKKGDTE